jgi:hypothetical protein
MDSENRRLFLGWIAFAALIGCLGVARPHPSGGSVHNAAMSTQEAVVDDGWRDWTWFATTTTTLPPPTTTVPPTTVPPTTLPPAPPPPPPPTTVAAPRTPPTTRVQPTPTTAPAPAPSGDLAAFAAGVLQEMVPAAWLAAVPARISVIDGDTSWAYDDGTIDMAVTHLASPSIARFTVAHEWGHLVAWKYGTNAYNGAAPAGFPYSGSQPAEMWADCVGVAISGVSQHSHGLPGCPGDALSFTSSWFAAGPPRR